MCAFPTLRLCFVGISDVAGYVRTRIQEAKEAIGTGGAIFVVSPSIQTEWNGSHWAEILPDLKAARRNRSYVRRVLGSSCGGLRSANAPRDF